MITGAQVRAARAIVRQSRDELAASAGVSITTIEKAEAADGFPEAMQVRALVKIRRALEAAGVEFDDGRYWGKGGPGIRLQSTRAES